MFPQIFTLRCWTDAYFQFLYFNEHKKIEYKSCFASLSVDSHEATPVFHIRHFLVQLANFISLFPVFNGRQT